MQFGSRPDKILGCSVVQNPDESFLLSFVSRFDFCCDALCVADSRSFLAHLHTLHWLSQVSESSLKV